MTARLLLPFMVFAAPLCAQMRVMEMPSHSPLVTFRFVFTVGAAHDPDSKPGLAYLTAQMIANSGTKSMTYRELEDAMFPLAASFDAQVDKEMTTFSATAHVDALEAYYTLYRSILLEPGWREEDFQRVKDDCISAIKTGLRNNDEELAKEVLYSDIYEGTPYGHYNGGSVSSLEAITLDDVKSFYATRYAQGSLILGISGGFTPQFLERVKTDMHKLPLLPGMAVRSKVVKLIPENRVTIVEKEARATAISIGFPLSCTLQDPDYAALLVASSYLGQHRESGRLLYDEMREKRGLNYGDYTYIEYFPLGMYRMTPPQNLARRRQVFQIWIRPVQPETAKFALRLALYELSRTIKNGIPPDQFLMTRDFVSKFLNVELRTQSALLGYNIDGLYYDTLDPVNALKLRLSKLTADDVNKAMRRYLRTDRLSIAIVANHAEDLRNQLASDDPSPMTYNTPKPQDVLDVDKVVEKWPLGIKAENVNIIPADQVYQ